MTDEVEKHVSSPEFAPIPEVGKENAAERAPMPEQPAAEETPNEAVPAAPVALPVPEPAAPADPVARSVEKILAEDLYEHFKAMPPAEQAKFRAKGEETVSKIMRLMSQAAIKAKEVLSLIAGWLKLIPGVNKYFLEQESKIKTDKIIELHRRQHGE